MPERSCPECGAELDADAAFCPECGAAVDGGDRPTRGAQARNPTDNRTFAAITHVLAIFTWVIGPVIILVATDDMFVKENARNATNWQIMFTIYAFISGLLILLVIGFVFLVILGFLNLVFCIIAAVKASEGEAWKYPATISLV